VPPGENGVATHSKTLTPPDLFIDPVVLLRLKITFYHSPFDVQSATARAQIIELHLVFDFRNRLVKHRVDGRDGGFCQAELVRIERPRRWVSVQQPD
jgi:hypothetical protein